MTTWAAALVKASGNGELATTAAHHGIAIIDAGTPWLLVQVDVNFGSLHPPKFEEALSRELQTTVIAFFLQRDAIVGAAGNGTCGK